MYPKLILVAILLYLPTSILVAQNEQCPTVPEGLTHIVSMKASNEGNIVKLSLSDDRYSDYLKVNLAWNVLTGDITAEADEKTVEALKLVDQLDFEDSFYTDNDASHLSLSSLPDSDMALYIAGDSPPTLYSANVNTLQTQALGTLTENLSDVDVIWYSATQAIIVVTPIYGPGFYSYDVCTDGSCFTDLTETIGFPSERPAIDIQSDFLATYNTDSSTITIVELTNKTLYKEYVIEHRLLANQNPIWSADGLSLYVLGFDDNLANLVVYRITISTGDIELIAKLNDTSDSILGWLILPDNHVVVTLDTELHVICYA